MSSFLEAVGVSADRQIVHLAINYQVAELLSCENQDKRWVPDNAGNRLCAQVARAVYDHFDRPGSGEAKGKKTADNPP